MNLINNHYLVIFILITNSVCFDKYVHFTKSKYGEIRFNTKDNLSSKETRTQQFDGFNTSPKILLGISGIYWIDFTDKENEFVLSIEEIAQTYFKVLLISTPESTKHIQDIFVQYLLFDSEEAFIHQNIKIDEQDIQKMRSNGAQSKIKQSNKLFYHQLQKKLHSKRKVSCFILGYRQEFSTSPPKSDSVFSFFVESFGDFNNNNQFQLIFTTLNDDEQNIIKWVNLNCIEYYDYDQYFQPNEFIYQINENTYGYSSMGSFILEGHKYLDIKRQVFDIQNNSIIFYGISGIDIQINGSLAIFYQSSQDFSYYSRSTCRAVQSIFILFKMYNCPSNCEDCESEKICKKCKAKSILNNGGVCVDCKTNCLFCDNNLDCFVCEQPFFQYKGECYLSQPKRTYCLSRLVYPPFDNI